PGVDVLGSVPDVRPFVQSAAIAVIPLRIARGIQNKVLEAMAMERAVVASPEALEGLALTPGREVLSASSPTEWVQAISTLFNDESRRTQYARSGREFVEKHHSWEQCLKPLERILDLCEENCKVSFTVAIPDPQKV